MTIYMKCTTDRLELPIAVADTAKELARMLGVSHGSVYSGIDRGYGGYHKVVIDEWYPDNDERLWCRREDGSVEYKE